MKLHTPANGAARSSGTEKTTGRWRTLSAPSNGKHAGRVFPASAVKIICTFAVIMLFHAPVPAADSESSHLSSDPSVKEARSLVKSRRFGEALDILRPLVKSDHPDKTDIRFLTGLAAIGMSEKARTEKERTALLNEAADALRSILVERPGLVRVRLELARAFFFKGDYELSRRHFERVLAGNPPPAVARNIRRFLEVMRAERRWSRYFGFALAPDTNINAASEDEIIYINFNGIPLPFRRDADSTARSGVGAVLWGGAEYQRPVSRRLRLRAGTDMAHREYEKKDFDQTFVSAHFGPRWLAGRNTETSLLASARHSFRAGKRYSRELGVRFESEHRFTRRLLAYGRASWHMREYRRGESLDGPVTSVSLGAQYIARPTVRTDAAAGYSLERPKSVIWRNSGLWMRAGVSVALPMGFTVGGSGEFRRIDYKGAYFTPGNADRKDKVRIFRVSIFNRAFTLTGFSPQLALVSEERKSNSQLQDYKRKRVELQFMRQF